MTARTLLRHGYLSVRGALLAPLALLRRPAVLPRPCRKILLVRVDRIGDLVLSTPFLRNLRQLLPSGEITLVGRAFAAELLHGGDLVDRIVVISPSGGVEAVGRLASEVFDLAVDLHYDYPLRTARLARRVRARCTAGFDIGGRGALFDVPVPARQRKHFVEETLDILRALGLAPCRVPLEVHLRPQAADASRSLLSCQGVGDPYVVFHPGGFYAEQRWPAPRFAQLADRIAELGLAPVLIGGKEDRPLLQEIAGPMKANAALICGQGVGVAAAAIAGSTLFVGNNSGPLHIACALDVPSVSTLGPTDPVRFWPLSTRARVLRAERLDQLPVEDMLDVAKTALASTPGRDDARLARPAG
ncbi:MAG TPA: glycosyltransferase family 9 protein [Candidatus Methylomirabilis sp.]|nr:glycosyltransferase family 9 protein [Candidatus Methylomirabilis sp.]